jgi:hypothetical protein
MILDKPAHNSDCRAVVRSSSPKVPSNSPSCREIPVSCRVTQHADAFVVSRLPPKFRIQTIDPGRRRKDAVAEAKQIIQGKGKNRKKERRGSGPAGGLVAWATEIQEKDRYERRLSTSGGEEGEEGKKGGEEFRDTDGQQGGAGLILDPSLGRVGETSPGVGRESGARPEGLAPEPGNSCIRWVAGGVPVSRVASLKLGRIRAISKFG